MPALDRTGAKVSWRGERPGVGGMVCQEGSMGKRLCLT